MGWPDKRSDLVCRGGCGRKAVYTTKQLCRRCYKRDRAGLGIGQPVQIRRATAMTQLATIQYNATNHAALILFGLMSPPTGTQTITVTLSAGTTHACSANSISYKNVSGFRTAQTTSASSGTALTQTVTTGQANDVIVQMFADYSSGDITAYTKTQRWNVATISSVGLTAALGEAAGAASVVFGATGPASAFWGGAAVPLIPS
jgi:hypothetical protein